MTEAPYTTDAIRALAKALKLAETDILVMYGETKGECRHAQAAKGLYQLRTTEQGSAWHLLFCAHDPRVNGYPCEVAI